MRHQAKTVTVKNKRGETIQDKNVRLKRWAEHFEEVWSGGPTNLIEENVVESDEIREMNTTEIKEEEVRQALKKTESGRTPGNDRIPGEL